MLGFNVFVIFLLVLFIFVVVAGVKIVPQGYNYTVERFGAAIHARSVRASPLSSHSSTASGGSST
jgi:regulator of protease activity HflC (stomatin/prohibitin superfamily)